MDLSEILEASFDGIWICDAKGRVQMINKASSKMNLLKPKAVIGKRENAKWDLCYTHFNLVSFPKFITNPTMVNRTCITVNSILCRK